MRYQKRNGHESFQQVSRNISNKEKILQCVIWIPKDLFYLWCPTPIWNPNAIRLSPNLFFSISNLGEVKSTFTFYFSQLSQLISNLGEVKSTLTFYFSKLSQLIFSNFKLGRSKKYFYFLLFPSLKMEKISWESWEK